MVPNFKKFVFENLDDDSKKEIRALGFGGVDVDEVASELQRILPDYSRWEVDSDGNILKATFEYDADADEFFEEKRIYRQLDRPFSQEVELIFDFNEDQITVNWSVSQKEINLDKTGTYTERCTDYLNYTEDSSSAEIAEDMSGLLESVIGFEDSLGAFDLIKGEITDAVHSYFGEEDEDDEEDSDEMYEKKKLKFHHSDAPDANGKFKELGVQKLADWLIRTRGGNMQKITGSLNQQINFNKRKNPSYAKKMESTREAVKRKLAKKKDK